MARYYGEEICPGRLHFASPGSTNFGPLEVCDRLRSWKRWVCSFRRGQQESGRTADCDGERGLALRRRAGGAEAAGRGSSSYQHAVLGTLRATGRGLPRGSTPDGRRSTRVCGKGSKVWLGTVRRAQRGSHRNENFRSLGAAESAAAEVRVHRRRRRSCRTGTGTLREYQIATG